MPQVAFDQLMQAFAADPWQALALSRGQHKSSRRREWELAAIGYAFAQWIGEQPKHLQDFYDDDFFERGYRPNPRHLLLHVLQYQRNDRHGEDGDRAQVHAAALQGAFAAGWSAEDVLAGLVEHRGFAPFRRWFDQGEAAADGGDELSEADADRRQLGLAPIAAATGRGATVEGDEPAAEDDEYDVAGAHPDEASTGVASDDQRAAKAAGSRSPHYADDIGDLVALQVLVKPEVFDGAMKFKEEDKRFIDIRLYRTVNGGLRYRRIEGRRLR